MKNMISSTLLILTILSCSSNDGDPNSEANKNVTGTVQTAISCQSNAKVLIYEIKLENHPTLKIFGAPDLPEKYKKTGLRLTFDIGKKSEDISFCVALYEPDYFHDVSNVSLRSADN